MIEQLVVGTLHEAEVATVRAPIDLLSIYYLFYLFI